MKTIAWVMFVFVGFLCGSLFWGTEKKIPEQEQPTEMVVAQTLGWTRLVSDPLRVIGIEIELMQVEFNSSEKKKTLTSLVNIGQHRELQSANIDWKKGDGILIAAIRGKVPQYTTYIVIDYRPVRTETSTK